MNTAINDHIAQFVKGAHILSSGAVALLVLAAAQTTFTFSSAPSPVTQTKIIGPVSFSSPELDSLRDDVASLKKEVANLSNAKAKEERDGLLEDKIHKRDTGLNTRRKVMPVEASKKAKTQ